MKVVVYGKAMFELDIKDMELSVNHLTAFLISKKFYNIGDWHVDNDFVICTAEFDGKNKFEMPDIDIPEFYIHRLKLKGLDFQNRTSYNANMLNELCRRNGRER